MSKRRSLFKLIQFLLIISCLVALINCQESNEEEEKLNSQRILGIGTGTFALIIFLIIGVIICIFGMATPIPGVFIAIGVIIPTLVFVILIFCPVKEKENETNSEDKSTNIYIVFRWLHFTIMLVVCLGLIGPMILLWCVTIIPQRVDSRAQKKYDERYKEQLREQILKFEKDKKEKEKMKKEVEDNLNNQQRNQEQTYQDPTMEFYNPENRNTNKFSGLRRRKKNKDQEQ